LRVYNRHGRRDNIYKARIKILVKALGVNEFAKQVEDEWAHTQTTYAPWTDADWQRVAQHFTKPPYKKLPALSQEQFIQTLQPNERVGFVRWFERNVREHQIVGYSSVVLSLKPHGTQAPGDATAEQMSAIAELADRYSFGELRVTHEQNLVLADVESTQLVALWQEAKQLGLALSNIGLLTDIIACPGGDFCSLANAKSIPIAKAIQERFDHLDYLHDVGDVSINISGCINSCGHHHVGNIGILGVDKDGEEWFQVTLGGAQGHEAAIGKVIGRAFLADEIPAVIDRLIKTYVNERYDGERFIQTVWRLGLEPFKQAAYADDAKEKEGVV
jgi:sulfite reductase (NADPH) hemoprotein beta-component